MWIIYHQWLDSSSIPGFLLEFSLNMQPLPSIVPKCRRSGNAVKNLIETLLYWTFEVGVREGNLLFLRNMRENPR